MSQEGKPLQREVHAPQLEKNRVQPRRPGATKNKQEIQVDVHNSFIHNSPRLKATRMFITDE